MIISSSYYYYYSLVYSTFYVYVYLAGVRVDHAHVLLALVSLHHDLLHVDPDLFHPRRPKLQVDELEELLDVSQ